MITADYSRVASRMAVGPYLAIGLAIYIPWMLAGMYGVAIASLGTLVIALTS